MQTETLFPAEQSSRDARLSTIIPSDSGLATTTNTLLWHSSVEECAVISRENPKGDPEVIAYIVPSGPFVPDRLHSYLVRANPNGPIPSIYVPLATMPLTAEGQVDTAALMALPVCDSALIERWETHCSQNRGSKEVGVLVQDYAERLPAIHISDLLPASEIVRSERSEDASTDTDTGPTRTAPVRPMAFSDGGPLVIPENAPKTLYGSDSPYRRTISGPGCHLCPGRWFGALPIVCNPSDGCETDPDRFTEEGHEAG